MIATNPYQAPLALPVAATLPETAPRASELSVGVIDALKRTKPWATFLGVVSTLSCAFCFAFGIVAMSTTMLEKLQLPSALGIAYVALGLVMLFPSVQLVRYGSSIAKLVGDGTMRSLEVALDRQRGYWRFVGYVVLVSLVLYLLFFGGMIVAAVLQAGR